MKVLKWSLLLCKRIYKKPTFLLILLLIPLLVFGFGILSEGDSGLVTIALAARDREDPLARAAMDKLTQGSPLIRFTVFDSPELAEKSVRTGKADAAWIFAEDLQGKVANLSSALSSEEGLVSVLEREETVPLRLAREKLSGALFECCSHQMFLDYVRSHSPGAASQSDEALLVYYENAFTAADEIFTFSGLSSGSADPADGYLLTPVRGLLAVVAVICGFASAMYFLQDRKAGLFSWLPAAALPYVELGYHFIAVFHVCAVSSVALAAVGLAENAGREIVLLLLYSICVSVFACLLRALCAGPRGLAAALPLVAVASVAVCPVFFEFSALSIPAHLLPPTYVIRGAGSDAYLLWILLYTAVAWVLFRTLGRLRRI